MELKQVIKSCLKNKSKCEEAFFKMNYGKLMAVSLRMSPNRQIAEDLLQDSFIKIFKNINNLDSSEPAAVYSWCKRILTNTIIDYYRKKKTFELSFDDNFDIDIELNDDVSYVESKNLNSNTIIEAIQRLSPQYSLTFNLFVIDGYTHQEISEQLQISVGTSKSNLFRAKAKLRKELETC